MTAWVKVVTWCARSRYSALYAFSALLPSSGRQAREPEYARQGRCRSVFSIPMSPELVDIIECAARDRPQLFATVTQRKESMLARHAPIFPQISKVSLSTVRPQHRPSCKCRRSPCINIASSMPSARIFCQFHPEGQPGKNCIYSEKLKIEERPLFLR